jgi:hypothetical protein
MIVGFSRGISVQGRLLGEGLKKPATKGARLIGVGKGEVRP